jgi:hypothetical protein
MTVEENKSQIIIYQTENGETKLDVRFQDETVWLTQKLMAELFQTTSQNITIHLKNIFEEGELEEEATCKDFLQVQKEDKMNSYTHCQVARKRRHTNQNLSKRMAAPTQGEKATPNKINNSATNRRNYQIMNKIQHVTNARSYRLQLKETLVLKIGFSSIQGLLCNFMSNLK